MNERIKELIEQAEDYAAEQHDFHTHLERTLRYEAFKEKFRKENPNCRSCRLPSLRSGKR